MCNFITSLEVVGWSHPLSKLVGFAAQPDSFYFNVLPYAEDVREFQFPSFSNLPASWQPNEEQQEAADNLVKMLDLAPSGSKETLLPDLTPNPVLEVINYVILPCAYPVYQVPSRMCQKDCNSDVLFITFIYLLIHLFSFEWV